MINQNIQIKGLEVYIKLILTIEKKRPRLQKKDVQKIIKLNQNKYTSLNLPIPDLLLIDVEGAEYEVLKGFDIDLSKIKFIVLESSISKNHVGAKTLLVTTNY